MTAALALVLVVAVLAALAAAGWWLARRRGGSGHAPRRRSPGSPSAEPPSDTPTSVSAPPEAGTPADGPAGTRADDDGALPGHDLRFAVHRPGVAVPGRWYDLLVFMYESPDPSDRLAWEIGPEKRIEREVRRIVGEHAPPYVSATEDAAAAVPREGMLTFVVELPGFQVNPPSQSVAWHEDLQRVRFRIRAGSGLEDTTARGRLTVFHGPLILAEMALVIPVGEREEDPRSEPLAPYRKIFASYAREDDAIVRRLGTFAESVGDRYLRDVASLRSGEEWNPGLARLIEDADVFQLFWSWNAMESEWVRREWTHALDLGRPGFVRPVYWEDPLPRRPERGLPPPELSELHFHRLPAGLVGGPAEPEPSGVDAGESTVMLPPTEPGSSSGGEERRGPSAYTRIIRPSDPGRPRPGEAPSPAPGGVPASADTPSLRRRSRTPSWLPWGLPAAAVAILALGTSTLLMVDGRSSAGVPMPLESPPDADAGADPDRPTGDARAPAEVGPDIPTGLLVAEVTLDGAPLGGVEVRVETRSGTVLEATTSPDGRVTFPAVPRGAVNLTVPGAPGGSRLLDPPAEVLVTPGDTARVTLRLVGGEPGPVSLTLEAAEEFR